MYKINFTETDVQDIISSYLLGNGCVLISRIYNVCPETILNLLRANNVPLIKSRSRRKYTLNTNYFLEIDSEDKAYFLGLICADGYNNIKLGNIELTIHEKDVELLENLKLYIKSDCPIVHKKSKIGRTHVRLVLCSRDLSNQLINLGCGHNKTFELSETIINKIPRNLLSHFVRGYFDGDGHINYKHLSSSIVSTDKFIITLKDIFKTEGITSCIIPHHSAEGVSELRLGGRYNLIKLGTWMYKNATISLNRKKIIFDLIIKNEAGTLKLEKYNKIAKLYSENNLSHKELSVIFNISTRHIERIVKGFRPQKLLKSNRVNDLLDLKEIRL